MRAGGAVAEVVEGAAQGGVWGGDAVEDFAEVGGEDEEGVGGGEVGCEGGEGGFRFGSVMGFGGWRVRGWGIGSGGVEKGFVLGEREHAFHAGDRAVGLRVEAGQEIEHPLAEVWVVQRPAPHGAREVGFEPAVLAVSVRGRGLGKGERVAGIAVLRFAFFGLRKELSAPGAASGVAVVDKHRLTS